MRQYNLVLIFIYKHILAIRCFDFVTRRQSTHLDVTTLFPIQCSFLFLHLICSHGTYEKRPMREIA